VAALLFQPISVNLRRDPERKLERNQRNRMGKVSAIIIDDSFVLPLLAGSK
jgi:hypothetical protein